MIAAKGSIIVRSSGSGRNNIYVSNYNTSSKQPTGRFLPPSWKMQAS
ncbi:hypothetical protein [Dictyobacter kobayashii]|nr:hypothetical protein [Dictyobacter kobayashii]